MECVCERVYTDNVDQVNAKMKRMNGSRLLYTESKQDGDNYVDEAVDLARRA
jgi:hypothetical protein